MNDLKPNKQTTIFTLLELGKSQREIERASGIDRKTIRAYQRKYVASQANSPGVATGEVAQTPPPRPPDEAPSTDVANPAPGASKCEPWREFIEAQLRLKRNATAIYQDLVDLHGLQMRQRDFRRERCQSGPRGECHCGGCRGAGLPATADQDLARHSDGDAVVRQCGPRHQTAFIVRDQDDSGRSSSLHR